MTNRWGTVETVSDFILGGSKITADGAYSHESIRHLLLGRKVMTNIDSILSSHPRPHTSPHHLTPNHLTPINTHPTLQTSHPITSPPHTPSPHSSPHPTPHTPPASKARGERWGLSLKSPQPQSCLWKAPRAEGSLREGRPLSGASLRAPPSCSGPSLPRPGSGSFGRGGGSHPVGSRGGPQGRECGLESPEAVAPCLGGCPAGQRTVGLRGGSSWAGGTAAGWEL